MRLARKIEVAANVAAIVIAIIISAMLVKTYLPPTTATRPAQALAGPEVSPGAALNGKVFGVDWTKNRRTLVMAISTTCHFCLDSAPFYRKLGSMERDTKIVAILPQSVSEGAQYLGSEGVRVDEVKHVALNSVGVRGTPTLLLVNNAGVVTNVWIGKLQPAEETQVLSAIEKKTSGD